MFVLCVCMCVSVFVCVDVRLYAGGARRFSLHLTNCSITPFQQIQNANEWSMDSQLCFN